LLIKPGYTFFKIVPGRGRDTSHALGRNPIPKKRKSPLDIGVAEERRYFMLQAGNTIFCRARMVAIPSDRFTQP
jgi:hypothetical protein